MDLLRPTAQALVSARSGRVNSRYCPNYTPLWCRTNDSFLEGASHPEEWIEEAVATRPFGRLLMPIDIAHAAAYFASDDAECVTGTVMDLEQHPVGRPPDM